jgi:murein DD-endopeptidase MepM/ murein hydrolase activator NlpD
MVALGNPVRGYIAPRGTVVPAGSFVVTSTFAEHVASGRGGGIDIGDQKCGSDIIAMGRGKVTAAYRDPNGSYIVRYALLDYPGYEAGLAHMPSLETSVGVTFAKGTLLGHIGTSGATACHLHGGMKLNGVEIDWWPLLIQNGATDGGGDMIPIPGANYKRIANKKASLLYNGNFRNERKSGEVLKQFPAGTVFFPVAYANDGDVPTGSQSGEWFYCILYDDSPAGFIGGWFHSSLVGGLTDEVTVGGGFTQAQLDAAVKTATDPLNARIATIKAKVAAGASDISDD